MNKYDEVKAKFDPAKYGHTAYIVGGGPSLKNFDWNDLQGKFVIAINRSYEVLPDAQIVYFTDIDFWKTHKEAMLKHKGTKIKGTVGNQYANHPDVIEYVLSGPQGLETTPGQLRHGYNSTYAALNLVTAHLGFKAVYLLGIDMKWGKRGDRSTSHWHSGHARQDAERVYTKMAKAFNTIVRPLQQLNVRVFNVTRNSDLTVFPKVDFTAVFGDKYAHRVMESMGQDEKLLGDKVEAVLQKVGAKKVMQVVERVTRKPCNCGQRKQALNNLHRVLRRNKK